MKDSACSNEIPGGPIGFVLPNASRAAGGVFEAVRLLAAHCQRLGERPVNVFSIEDDFSEQDAASWDPCRVILGRGFGPRTFGYSSDLSANIIASKPDVLHLHGLWMYPSVALYRAASQLSVRYAVSPHGMLDPWALRQSAWKKKIVSALFERRGLGGAACVFALTHTELESVRSFGIRVPVCVIPNGVTLPNERSVPRPSLFSQIPSGVKILLFLGRLHPKKGLAELLHAWSKIDDGDWHLAIVGWEQGDYGSKLRSLSKSLGLNAERVSFLGPAHGETKDAVFRHSDGFILPSHSEGLPMAVLEAWSYGLPVILSPACNLPDGLRFGAGFSVEPNHASIEVGIRQLIDCSPIERMQIGLNGRKLVSTRFSWDIVGKEMLAVYEWMLGGRRPAQIDVI